ncbi:hypothetical protein B0H12DRAFT_354920 [Mycena haematopus]|nr:hypothetical protein B0H12DRAFT_354920 [Mycena haematopus]
MRSTAAVSTSIKRLSSWYVHILVACFPAHRQSVRSDFGLHHTRRRWTSDVPIDQGVWMRIWTHYLSRAT